MEPAGRDTRILLVEDDELFAETVAAKLSDSLEGTVEVTSVSTLAAALEALGARRFEAILLDLSLSDSDGFEGVERVKLTVPDIPIVVLTGTRPVDLGVEALRRGAQDYLIKSQSDGASIARSIRYAIERERTNTRFRHTIGRLQDRDAAESESGSAPLVESNPELHRNLAGIYSSLLELALRPGIHASEQIGHGSDELAALLHQANASPRDIVDVHLEGLSWLTSADRRSGSATTEGQMLVLEVMGKTMSLYREEVATADRGGSRSGGG